MSKMLIPFKVAIFLHYCEEACFAVQNGAYLAPAEKLNLNPNPGIC